MNEKVKPIHEIRLSLVKAAIWANQTKQGGTRYSVSFSRIYRKGDAWKNTESYGRDDLAVLCRVAEQAQLWILQEGAHKPAK